MSMSQRQTTTVTNDVIKRTLKQGVLPNTKDINKKVETFFADKTLGLPYFTPNSVEKYEVSSDKEYNKMFNSLDQDFNNLFDENVYQNNRVISMFDSYITEKELVDSSIEKMQLRLSALSDMLKDEKIAEGYIENFSNFYGIELYGSKSRNIPKTTSFIDLVQRKVYNEKVTKPSDKIDITNAKVTFTPIDSYVGINTYGEYKNLLKDTVNESLLYVLTTENDGNCSIEILVELEKAVEASSILINTKTTKAVDIQLYVSEDNTNYKNLLNVETISFAEWNFNKGAIKYLKFIVKKYESDGEVDNSFEYYFTFTNISVINDTFVNKSVLVTKQIPINKIANKCTLYSDDIVFPNTDIKYYIGIDNGYDAVDWEVIQNGVQYDFGLLNTKRDIITGNTNQYSYNSTTKCSTIGTVLPNTDLNTINLKLGYQMWMLEVFDIPFDVYSQSTFTPGIQYMGYTKLYNKFIDCEKYNLDLDANKMYVYTQYVDCDNPINIANKYISGINIKYSIWINNVQIQPIDGKYNIQLAKGMNKVQMCIYSAQSTSVLHNINMKMGSFNIYCTRDLKQITEYNLINNTQDGDLNYYSIDSNGNILVKYDVTDANLCFNVNSNDKIRYVVEYKYAGNDLIAAYPNRITKVRLMAILTSSYKDISPQIVNIRLISE